MVRCSLSARADPGVGCCRPLFDQPMEEIRDYFGSLACSSCNVYFSDLLPRYRREDCLLFRLDAVLLPMADRAWHRWSRVRHLAVSDRHSLPSCQRLLSRCRFATGNPDVAALPFYAIFVACWATLEAAAGALRLRVGTDQLQAPSACRQSLSTFVLTHLRRSNRDLSTRASAHATLSMASSKSSSRERRCATCSEAHHIT